MNVYINADASVAPTLFEYDMNFLSQTAFTINSNNFPSLSAFQVMIRVFGVVSEDNNNFENTVDVTFSVSTNARVEALPTTLPQEEVQTSMFTTLSIVLGGILVSGIGLLSVKLRGRSKSDENGP